MVNCEGGYQVELIINRVAKTYYDKGLGREVLAVSEVSFWVKEGEFICIIGPSGGGKTTLINMIAGFIKPTAGAVYADGHQVEAPGPDRSVVFQEPTLFPWFTVQQNIQLGLVFSGGNQRGEWGRITNELLELVGLSEFARARPHELSGGMKHRAALARALALDSSCLLMDEPFASLDSETRRTLQESLLDIWTRGKKTIMCVTHNIDEALLLADRILVFTARPGRIKADLRVAIPRPRHLYPELITKWRGVLFEYLKEEAFLDRGMGEGQIIQPAGELAKTV